MSETKNPAEMVDEIVKVEIRRMYDKQAAGSLEIGDIKQLVELSRAWKNMNETPPPKEGGSLDHLSLEALMALVKDETKPTEHTGSPFKT